MCVVFPTVRVLWAREILAPGARNGDAADLLWIRAECDIPCVDTWFIWVL